MTGLEPCDLDFLGTMFGFSRGELGLKCFFFFCVSSKAACLDLFFPRVGVLLPPLEKLPRSARVLFPTLEKLLRPARAPDTELLCSRFGRE